MQLTDEGVAEELRMDEEHSMPRPPRLLPPLGPEAVAAGGIRPGPKLVVDDDGQQWLAWKQEEPPTAMKLQPRVPSSCKLGADSLELSLRDMLGEFCLP